jgi:hypothetical protein
MSSNDLTQNLPSDATIKPTIETVLERINAVAEALTLRMNDIANDIAQLRKDVEQGFRRVERKIAILKDDFLAIRGNQKDMLRRIESLESKAS